jgi:long-chain fatty acid transport protein
MVKKAVWPPALYASWASGLPNGMRYGLGGGMNIPGGGYVFWPRDWPGRFDITDVDRKVYAGYLNGSLQPFPFLRVAAGVVYYRTTEYLRQAVNFVGSESYAELGTSGDAWSYHLAMEADPLPGLRVGLDYKHQGVQKLTGKAHFANPPSEFGAAVLDQDVTHVLTYPNVLHAGASYQVTSTVVVAAAYTFERFKPAYPADIFIGDAGTTIAVERNYKNNHVFRLGAEWQAVKSLKLRGGILRDASPTPSAWMSPTIPDSPVWGFSAGVGYAIAPSFTLNASYFRAVFQTITTDPANVFPGTYDTRANIFSLGFTWDWTRS